ncbi:hypothetical protein [Phytohalomonas tamaricis]|uniref:hypothetical protein n=1 Tax=Phytohalomonas tamaricis TaxID=2081032 RepID=UPI000D0BC154|nr:hypothetical protein [Phytohalomonas tamaricis]
MNNNSECSQHGEPRLGDDIVMLFGVSLKRRTIAFGVAGVLAVMGFILLFTGYMNGGAFVSMLTLAFGSGLFVLVWERVEKFTLFGNEIKLRRLSRDAENMLAGLEASKSELYATALRVALRTSSGSDVASEIYDERNDDVLHVLHQIENAGLLKRMSKDVLHATDTLIKSTITKIGSRQNPLWERFDASEYSDSEELTMRYDRWREEVQDADSDTELERTIDQLKALQRYRRLAMY